MEHLRLPEGWASPGYLVADELGDLVHAGGAPPTDAAGRPLALPWTDVRGFGLPGMLNVHSHAFQRAMAGHGERRAGQDDFWSWRQEMYGWAAALDEDDLQAVTEQAYVEMLQGGYTSVAEFHYLHERLGVAGSANETSLRTLAAAEATGIDLLLVPTYYATAGIGRPPEPKQRRFVVGDVDAFVARVEALPAGLPVALGLHSLRAVPASDLHELVPWFGHWRPEAPIHIHAAEQQREVDECLVGLGARPVRWLLDRAGLDRRWCLIHATHLEPDEVRDLARSGAVAGLCPTTEANLGDGVFPFQDFVAAGGAFGLGTDSHVVLDASEELRWLEGVQRLAHQRRCLAADAGQASTGERLWERALQGGSQALGRSRRALAVGAPCDLVVLDADDPRLVGHAPASVLDAWIFSPGRRTVRDVWVRGHQVLAQGRHPRQEAVLERFRATLGRVRARMGAT